MAQVSNTNNELKRTMKSRHLFMIALGGVIGTGLFNGSGFIISQADLADPYLPLWPVDY